jgi:hypothetical protein
MEMEPSFVPAYNKPDSPGIAMNFDNTVSMLAVIGPEDDFLQAANQVFGLLKEAEDRYPGWPRSFYVDIVGHSGDRSGFDEDFFEFQQEFWFATIAHFVTAFELPVTGALANPQPQRNDIPDALNISTPPDSA